MCREAGDLPPVPPATGSDLGGVRAGLVWAFRDVLQAAELHAMSLRWMLPVSPAPCVVWWDHSLEQVRLAKAGNYCRRP